MRRLQDGVVIRDTLEVERLLGEGGFAEVYRVRHRFLRRRFAMKVFKTPFDTLDRLEERLEESRLLSSLEHRNIVRLHDAGLIEVGHDRFGYFTMEYVAGGSLDGYWRAYGAQLMPVADAVDILKQTCLGLAVAHGKTPPIIHRDIKPHNILVGYDGEGPRVRLSDFGLAKAVDPLTMLASAQGTLAFKPPEAFDDQDTTASDVWAIGTTLYLLLTDQLPYPQLDDRDLSDARRFLRPLRPPSVYNITVNAALDAIVFRCLAADQGDRYTDATDLLTDLERWQPEEDGSAFAPSGSPEKSHATPLKQRIAAGSDNLPKVHNVIREAFNLAKDTGRLDTAADLLEQAVNREPGLRARYTQRLQLWRRGIWL